MLRQNICHMNDWWIAPHQSFIGMTLILFVWPDDTDKDLWHVLSWCGIFTVLVCFPVSSTMTSGVLFCSRDDISLATHNAMATYTRSSLNSCILATMQTHHTVVTYSTGDRACRVYQRIKAGTSHKQTGTILLSPSLCVSKLITKSLFITLKSFRTAPLTQWIGFERHMVRVVSKQRCMVISPATH